MARRKRPPELDYRSVELPVHLRWDVACVEDFVPWLEGPPVWWQNDDDGPYFPTWRRIRALRRWQAAVTELGTKHGLDRRALRQWVTGQPARRGSRTRPGWRGSGTTSRGAGPGATGWRRRRTPEVGRGLRTTTRH